MSKAKYFLGRVIKLGILSDELIVQSILEPETVLRGNHEFTFTEGREVELENGSIAVYGRLAKYSPKGEAIIVQTEEHREETAEIPNLLVASSPFVYLPEFSGLAYQHIWNFLEKSQFEKLFAQLVMEKHERFFVTCSVEAISDLVTFVRRLAELDTIFKLEATVNPPNPLFGPSWEILRDYIKRRNADEVHIREKADAEDGLASDVAQLASKSLNTEGKLKPLGEGKILEIGDAAVLMAVDGYGKAKVYGRKRKKKVVLRTQESQISFPFAKEPEAQELAAEAQQLLQKNSEGQALQHSDDSP